MQHRRLGRSGLWVSEISYGNWVTHGAQVDEEQAISCVRAAVDSGITTFDTADVYAQGAAEAILGKALRGLPRESVVIATKLYWPTGPGPNDKGLSRKHIMESLHRSLRRLGTDYVDLYQAHRFDPQVPLEETLRAFEDLVRQGKVLYLGVSEWWADQISRALQIADERGFDRVVSNQAEYSAIWRVIEPEVLPLCRKEGLGTLVFSPLAQGVLTGKYRPGEPPPPGSRATSAAGANFIQRLLRPELLEAVARLRQVAAEAGMSLPRLALSWVLSQEGISSAIIGATTPDQIKENAEASGAKLDADLLQAVDEALGDQVIRDPSLTRSERGQ
jgi:aryl-alcohol dehydrogenase-like predicted oxidoreductase